MDTSSDSFYIPILATAASLAVGTAAGAWWWRQYKRQTSTTTNQGKTSSKADNGQSRNSSTATNPSSISSSSEKSAMGSNPTTASNTETNGLKNVWDAPRNLTSRQKTQHSKEKKFSSSYYYAHNDPNAKGGYKDGLQMEDYTMNQPRLLSKNGQPVSLSSSTTTTTKTEASLLSNDDPGAANGNNPETTKPIRHITKYLWDDPGDSSKGVATIRIDSVPDLLDSTRVVPYADVEFTSTEAKLFGEDLRVRLESPQARYELKIPKLYGDAAEVKTVTKNPKRLLVRLIKKKSGILSGNSKNLQAWPHPGRKV